MGAGGSEERMGDSGEDLHISEEEKLGENTTYSISCHNEPGGCFTYLALMRLQWPGNFFFSHQACSDGKSNIPSSFYT